MAPLDVGEEKDECGQGREDTWTARRLRSTSSYATRDSSLQGDEAAGCERGLFLVCCHLNFDDVLCHRDCRLSGRLKKRDSARVRKQCCEVEMAQCFKSLSRADLVLQTAACYPVYPIAVVRGRSPQGGLRFRASLPIASGPSPCVILTGCNPSVCANAFVLVAQRMFPICASAGWFGHGRSRVTAA